MYSRSEGRFKGYDGESLFFQEWIHPEAVASVIITHGQGEHSECYNRLVQGLSDARFSFYAWDYRGHGRSGGKRGYAKDFYEYCMDYELFLKLILALDEVKKGPVFLLAHSMGGLIQLRTLLDHPTLAVHAQVLSAPLLGLTVQVPKAKDIAAKTANVLYPKLTLWNELNIEQFSRDPEVLKEYPKDTLRHDRLSPGVYLGFVQAIEYVQRRAHQVKLPTLLQLGGSDSVVSTPAAESFFEHLGASIRKKIVYSGAYHEIYNDLDRKAAYQDIMDFSKPFLRKS